MENTEKKEVKKEVKPKKYAIKTYKAELALNLFNRAIIGGVNGELTAKIRIVRSKLKSIVLEYYSNRESMLKDDFGLTLNSNNQFDYSNHPRRVEIKSALFQLEHKEVELPELELIENSMDAYEISAFTVGMNGVEFDILAEDLKMIKQ